MNSNHVQCIIIVAVLVCVGIERICRVQRVDNISLIDLCLREVVVVSHGRDHVAGLPVANTVHCGLACVQVPYDDIKAGLSDGIAFSERTTIIEFLVEYTIVSLQTI